MANKWAVQNGNWSDGSTWNDGVVPTADDDVWLNGKTLTDANNSSITAKTISNGVCVETGLSGGSFTVGDQITINISADIRGYNSYVFEGGAGATARFNIIGNCYNYVARVKNYSAKINVTGNVYNDNYAFGFTSGVQPPSVSIVGVCEPQHNIVDSPNMTVYINGRINFVGDYISQGVTYNFTNVQIVDISRSSASQFPLVGTINCNFKLITDNPQPSDVRAGVHYDNNNKIGTLQIPQPSVVLEGYEYDDKIGELKIFNGTIVEGTIVEDATIIQSATVVQGDNISVVNLTEQQLQRVGNCATVSTVQKCFEEFKE